MDSLRPSLRLLCLPLLASSGCVVLGRSAHEERIELLGSPTDAPTPVPTPETGETGDTDPPTPTGNAPVLSSAQVRFAYDDFGFHQGLQLLLQVADVDGDLAGGEVQIQGGAVIPWSRVTPLVDDHYLVPLDLDLGEPCAEPTPQDLVVFVRDLAGNASDTRQARAGWSYRHHDESGIASQNACEPCAGTIEPDDLPVVVCGRLGINHGYADGIDSMLVLLSPTGPEITAVANLQAVSGLVSFNYGTETEDLVSLTSDDGAVGLVIQPEPVTVPVANYLYMRNETGNFDSADWTIFIDERLPPLPR